MKPFGRGPTVPLVCLTAVLAGAAIAAGRSARSTSPAASTVRPEAVRALPGHLHTLEAEPVDRNYAYGARDQGGFAVAAAAQTATINVTYTGFTQPAQAAFQAAVDIWKSIITSTVPINVDATFTTSGFGSTTLGSAGPKWICTSSGGQANTYYPKALANKFAGADVCVPGDFDITARFNSGFTNWDFGTTPVSGTYNFMTVVLHELCHGLGFYGSMTVDTSGNGSYRTTPDIYDRFALNGALQALLSFASPSTALASQLISSNIFFDGTNAKASNSGNRPKLETTDFRTLNPPPSNNFGFKVGSSYSHLDDASYTNTANGLMTWALGTGEVYTDPGPIVRGIFQDEGWTVAAAPTCTFGVSPTSATYGAAGGSGSVTVTTQAGCTWTATSNNSFITITGGASGNGNGTVAYTIASTTSARTGTMTIAGTTVTITQTTLPVMTLTPSAMNFGAVNNGAGTLLFKTPNQTLALTQSGTGTVTWTASSNQPWLTVTPTSGTGPAALTLSVSNASMTLPAVGSLTATVTVNTGSTGGNNPTAAVNLAVVLNGQNTAPAGFIDTPTDGQTGVTGSIAVTGWAIDDIGVTQVRLYRDAVTTAGEAPGLVFIGNAVFVNGARTDIAAANPTRPFKDQAGWGYLLLTNFLPGLGTGTYRLSAYADDVDGKTTLLGTKTITCSNATATKPFGAIDTPAQGQTVSGAILNFGWTLTPPPGRVPVDESTISVIVDGVSIGRPTDGGPLSGRSDVQNTFASGGYNNINSHQAVKTIDTTTLANGVHTIAWVVTDDLGRADGIGSRFFTVSNSSLMAGVQTSAHATPAPVIDAASHVVASPGAVAELAPSAEALALTTGFDPGALPELAVPDGDGVRHARVAQLDRLKIDLSAGGDDEATYRGYELADGVLKTLPVGSTLDAETGEFTWQPGLAFGGTRDLVFTRHRGQAAERIHVSVAIEAEKRHGSEPRLVIDTPGAGAAVEQPFVIAGWAVDDRATHDAGIDTLHVWAYPVHEPAEPVTDADPRGTDPRFVGEASHGGYRPDVAAALGPHAAQSGFGVTVAHLPPGAYDLVVYAHSAVTDSFVVARTVRVTVR